MATPVKVGGEFLVNTSTAGDQTAPSAAALTDGRFVIVWEDLSHALGDGSGRAVHGQVFEADGSKSGAEFLVNETTSLNQDMPVVTALADGRFVVAWSDFSEGGGDTSSRAVYARLFDADGSPVGNEFRVNSTTLGLQMTPTIAALDDGGFVIAWRNDGRVSGPFNIGLPPAINAQKFAPDGFTVGGEVLVSLTPKSSAQEPAIAALPGGGYVVAWTEYTESVGDGSSRAIKAQVFNAGGGATGAAFLVNTTTIEQQFHPAIAAFADGRFVITWDDDSPFATAPSPRTDVRAQVFDFDGSKIGGEILVTSDGSGVADDPRSDVETLPDGRFIVAWLGKDTDFGSLFAQVYNSDGSRDGDRFIVDEAKGAAEKLPTITALGGTRFMIAWEDHSGDHTSTGVGLSTYGVRAQIFDAGPSTGGGNTPTPGNDRLIGTAGPNTIDGLAGDDVIEGRGGDDILIGGAGDDTLDGGAGVDLASAEGATGVAYLDLLNNPTVFHDGRGFIDALISIEGAIGGEGDDAFIGDNGPNIFRGNGGIDVLIGGGGDDTLEGGDGERDYLMGGSGFDPEQTGTGKDVIRGEAGVDVIYGQDGNDGLHGGDGQDFILAGVGNDNVTGGAGDDFLFAAGAYDFDQSNTATPIYVGFPPDDLHGNDMMSGGEGNDFMVGAMGDDILVGEEGNDVIYGGSGEDILFGGGGDDFLIGDRGDDTIAGGAGFDYMHGGAGADLFMFSRGDSYDTIFDFSPGEGDRLSLDVALGFTGVEDFHAAATTFAHEGVDYTVIFSADGAVFDQLTIKGMRPDQFNETNLAFG